MEGIRIDTDVLDEVENLSQLIGEKLKGAKIYNEMIGVDACRIFFEGRTRLKAVKHMLDEAGRYIEELSRKSTTQYITDDNKLCIVAALQPGTRRPQISIYARTGYE